MLFNSLEFAVFIPVVFCVYWLLRDFRKWQNFFVLAASYFFYGYWDWRFLLLIFASSLVDFWVGTRLAKTENLKHRKWLLYLSLAANLGMLGYFKYANFFIDSFNESFILLGSSLRVSSLNVILPVGISFYTFQTLSYTIDVYKRKLVPTNDAVAFFAYVAFFPQLVAGPIERAVDLLPQFYKKRVFSNEKAVEGLLQIVWGLFKKMVIADGLATHVDQVFATPEIWGGSTLLVGILLFSCQVYCDFSGYSDIAIGLARLFGFELSQNFDFPFFSKNMAEFWRRWHMTLNSWFRDYVYIPMGGNRKGVAAQYFNIFTVFMLSGFWHGANATFLLFGFLNFIYFIPYLSKRPVQGKKQNSLVKVALGVVMTNIFIHSMMIAFRCSTLSDVYLYHKGFFSLTLFEIPVIGLKWLVIVLCFHCFECVFRRNAFSLAGVMKLPVYLQWVVIVFVFMLSILLKAPSNPAYVYFQF